jgi:DNA-binding MarR family transcriptional regulator
MVQPLSPSSATSTKKKLSRLTAPILVNSAEVEIMRALRRQGRISRGEISSITGWSKAKASQEIRSLVDKGYLVEVGEGYRKVGASRGFYELTTSLGILQALILEQRAWTLRWQMSQV